MQYASKHPSIVSSSSYYHWVSAVWSGHFSPQLAKWPALCTQHTQHTAPQLSAHAAAFQEQPLCRKVIERKPLHSKSLA